MIFVFLEIHTHALSKTSQPPRIYNIVTIVPNFISAKLLIIVILKMKFIVNSSPYYKGCVIQMSPELPLSPRFPLSTPPPG
jgi:hypothetical protein